MAGTEPRLRQWPTNTLQVYPFTAALNMSASTVITTINRAFRLVSVTIHISGAGTANAVNIYKDSIQGSAYDTLLATFTGAAKIDMEYTPPNPEQVFEKGTELYLTWTNDSTLTYGVEITIVEV